MTACKTDNTVPEFVGLQVKEWLQEIEEKNEGAQQPQIGD